MIYMLGLHLALRRGVEHTRLRHPGFDCQIIVNVDDVGRERLIYTEDPLQKMNQGGIGAKNISKKVFVYGATDKTRCPVRIFKKYIKLLPLAKSCKKLYLHPKGKVSPLVWFCDQPFGNNKIAATVKELCKKGGLDGHYTNHSLRATSASRMYQSNVPEQISKEITGHRSDCVRTYKPTSDSIRKVASETISGESGVVGEEQSVDNPKEEIKEEKIDQVLNEHQKQRLTESLSLCQMLKNVIRTRMELRKKKKKCKLGVKKVASKLVKKEKKGYIKRSGSKSSNKSIVIDLNVNVNLRK